MRYFVLIITVITRSRQDDNLVFPSSGKEYDIKYFMQMLFELHNLMHTRIHCRHIRINVKGIDNNLNSRLKNKFDTDDMKYLNTHKIHFKAEKGKKNISLTYNRNK